MWCYVFRTAIRKTGNVKLNQTVYFQINYAPISNKSSFTPYCTILCCTSTAFYTAYTNMPEVYIIQNDFGYKLRLKVKLIEMLELNLQ